MGVCETATNILTRGVVQIIYSSTTGTSKRTADQLQEFLEANQYIALITNIGDLDTDEYVNHRGTVIFLLSTYGDGSSPLDGQVFLQWIEKLEPQQLFVNMEYCVMAFGNSSFENHCRFGRQVDEILKAGGGQQLIPVTLCDSKSPERSVTAKFPEWSKLLVEILNSKNSLKEVPQSSIGSPYTVSLQEKGLFEWETAAIECKNTKKQFSNYFNMHRCKVIHMKQLRGKTKDGRSTLWIRIQINKDIKLTPACNVQIFPMNLIQSEAGDNLVASFSLAGGKVPFPPMPVKQIRKLVNLRQNANSKQITKAVLLSSAPVEVIQSYAKRLKQKTEIKVTCAQLLQDLKPRVEYLPQIGFNTVRPYTLASWSHDNDYVDLCVSLVKDGLASEYLKTNPEFVRINPIKSTFYIPQNRPIVMIANGTGIAPFRSIVQYFELLPVDQRVPIRLYFGIQDEEVDFYFGDEWRELEKRGFIQLRLAESRKDPAKKEYVQDVLQRDVAWLTDHLFKRNGVIFICGGEGMAKAVDKVIFQCLRAHVSVAYKAFTLSNKLKEERTIVEEIFG